MEKTTINHSNSDKAPLHWGNEYGLCYRRLLPMELEIKKIGHTSPGSDNNEK